MKKTNKQIVGIFFGGQSVEHEVSILTALQCYKAIRHSFKTKLIYIDQANHFYALPSDVDLQDFHAIYRRAKKIPNFQFGITIALNCCHGGIGEGGDLASIFEMLNIPYTSCTPTGALLTMDKNLTKLVLSKHKIPLLSAKQYSILPADDELQAFDYPVIVKPNRLGSSIGVERCESVEETKIAISSALMYDDSCIVEKCVSPLIEYNCAIIKHGEEYIISEIEQPLSQSETLTFEDKYLHSAKGMKSQSRLLPAPIPKALQQKIEDYTRLSYQILGLKGVVRIDYLYNPDTKKLYLNEINTIPGSLAFYLFEGKGINYVELVDIMLQEAKSSTSRTKITSLSTHLVDFALHKN